MRDAEPGQPLERLLDLAALSQRVAVVARVDAYQPSPPSADVTFLVRELRGTGPDRVALPAAGAQGCPVIWPGGGGRALTMGLEPGDQVIALYRHGDHAAIDAGAAGPVAPSTGFRCNDADVIILPMFVPSRGADPGTSRQDGQPVLALPTGEALHLGTPGAAFRVVIAEALGPFLAGLVTWLGAHVHGTAGTPPTVPPPTAPSVNDIASGRVKVDG